MCGGGWVASLCLSPHTLSSHSSWSLGAAGAERRQLMLSGLVENEIKLVVDLILIGGDFAKKWQGEELTVEGKCRAPLRLAFNGDFMVLGGRSVTVFRQSWLAIKERPLRLKVGGERERGDEIGERTC